MSACLSRLHCPGVKRTIEHFPAIGDLYADRWYAVKASTGDRISPEFIY
jgi:hypothetical protein